MHRFFKLALLLFPALLLSGCGGEKIPDGMPELHPYTILVTQDGKPLEGASIALYATSTSEVPTGLTGANGKAEMLTRSFKGVPDGEFKVSVKKEVPTPSKYGETAPPTDDQMGEWMANRAKEYRPTHCYVDAKFADANSSGVTVTTTGASEGTVDVGAAVDEIIIPEGSAKEPN